MYSRTTAPVFHWRQLYLRAVFATDPTVLARDIQKAREALLRRERELFELPQDVIEREAVNTALNHLDALRFCVRNRTNRFAA